MIEERGDKEYVRVGHEMELKGEGGEAVDSTLRKQTVTVERWESEDCGATQESERESEECGATQELEREIERMRGDSRVRKGE